MQPQPILHFWFTELTPRHPEFDTNRAKLLICIGLASGLPLQQAQLGVV